MKPPDCDCLGGWDILNHLYLQKDSALPRQAMSRNEYGTIAQAGRGLDRAKTPLDKFFAAGIK